LTCEIKGSFSNFKPSWHNPEYELGSADKFELLQNIRAGSNQTDKSEEAFSSGDILPTREEDLKRWSSDMDSNILF
jgi:hypothetical protein